MDFTEPLIGKEAGTLKLLAQATLVQAVTMVENSLASFIGWTGRCCLYPLRGRHTKSIQPNGA